MPFTPDDLFRLKVVRHGSQALAFEAKRKPKPVDGVWHYLIGGVFDLAEAEMKPDAGPFPPGYVGVKLSDDFDGGELLFDDASIGVVRDRLDSGRYRTVVYTAKISPTEL